MQLELHSMGLERAFLNVLLSGDQRSTSELIKGAVEKRRQIVVDWVAPDLISKIFHPIKTTRAFIDARREVSALTANPPALLTEMQDHGYIERHPAPVPGGDPRFSITNRGKERLDEINISLT